MNYFNLRGSNAGTFSLITIALFISVFSLTSFASAQEITEDEEYIDPEIIDAIIAASDTYICHATGDVNLPFEKVTVGDMLQEWDEINDVPHFGHENDIVPTATTSEDILAILEIAMPGISILATTGRNLDTEYPEYGINGQGIHDADCAVSTSQVDDVPNVEEDTQSGQCEIEGHKYDQTGTPLADWQIGLIKVITQGENKDVWDLASDTTDLDGYFCLEWDGETRQFRGEGEPTIVDGEYSFVYRVYEKLVDGWKNISVEMGPAYNNLEVVADEDIQNDGEEVSVQIGEEGGYIYADAAYHVDFYNKKDSTSTTTSTTTSTSTAPCVDTETVKCEVLVVENSSRHSGSSGTRVNRHATPEPQVLGVSTSSPAVLGEQVSVVPTGAPDTGAGGTSTNNTLTLSQLLFAYRRSSLGL
jgi:hypothetical protein